MNINILLMDFSNFTVSIPALGYVMLESFQSMYSNAYIGHIHLHIIKWAYYDVMENLNLTENGNRKQGNINIHQDKHEYIFF